MTGNNFFKGWFKESARHSLAAKGIKTGRKKNGIIKKIKFKKREMGYPLRKVAATTALAGTMGLPFAILAPVTIVPTVGLGVAAGTTAASVSSIKFMERRDKIAKARYHKPYQKLNKQQKIEVLKSAEEWVAVTREAEMRKEGLI